MLLAHTQIMILSACGDSVERSTPFFAWRTVFSSLFSTSEATKHLKSNRKRVLARMEKELPHLQHKSPLLNVVLNTDIRENEQTSGWKGEERLAIISELLIKVMRFFTRDKNVMLIVKVC